MAEYDIYNVGHELTTRETVKELFTKRNIQIIRDKTSQLLYGVHPDGKKIVVSDKVIVNVLSSLYNNDVGKPRELIDNAIHIIYSNIKDEFETNEQNEKLTPWVQLYGSNGYENPQGLQSHSKIKLRERRPPPMIFHMRY